MTNNDLRKTIQKNTDWANRILKKNGGDMLIINIGEETYLPRFYVSWSNQCNQWLSHLKLRFLFHRMRGVLELTLPDNVSPNAADRW
jgi:hypothetical protein